MLKLVETTETVGGLDTRGAGPGSDTIITVSD